jgi:hypothetical protein
MLFLDVSIFGLFISCPSNVYSELLSLTISTLGAKFGVIGVASPACTDDIVLLGEVLKYKP